MSDHVSSRTSNRLTEYISYPLADLSLMSPVNIASPATAAHNTQTNTNYPYDRSNTYHSNLPEHSTNIDILSVKSHDVEPLSPMSTQQVYFHNTDNEGDNEDITVMQCDITDDKDAQMPPNNIMTAPKINNSTSNCYLQPNNNNHTNNKQSIHDRSEIHNRYTDNTSSESTNRYLNNSNNVSADTHANNINGITQQNNNKVQPPPIKLTTTVRAKHIDVQPCRSIPNCTLQISRWGEIRPAPRPLTTQQLQQQKVQLMIDRERENKWLIMLRGWDMWLTSRSSKIKSRICKGIPDSLRGTVWPKITQADTQQENNSTLYTQYLNQHSEMEDVIMRDIHRTFPTNIFFKDTYTDNTSNSNIILRGAQGKTSLYNVLKAYSNYDRVVGYCQGMGFLTGLLLQYCNESTTFYILRQLLQTPPYQLSGLYQPSFPLLNQYFYIYSQLLKQRHSKLSQYFDELCIEPSFYSTQWFITLYSYNFPHEITLRIWDILFSQGTKVLFKTALYIITVLESQLLAAEYEQVIDLLKNIHKHECMNNVDSFINGALNIKLQTREIQKLAQDYGNKQLKQNDK